MEIMRELLRESLLRSVSLYAVAAYYPGLVVDTAAGKLWLSGLVLVIFNRLVKPIIKILTLPFNLLTFGFFNWVNQAVVLALVVKFWNQIQIVAFTVPAWQQSGFSFPRLNVGIILSYLIAAILLTWAYQLIDWLCRD